MAAAQSMQAFYQALIPAVYMRPDAVGVAPPSATHTPAGQERITLANIGGGPQWWFNEPLLGSTLIERPCYRVLWGLVWASWLVGNDTLIIGTPGIGKTQFLYYVMWKLVTANANVDIVVEVREEDQPNNRYRFHGANVIKGGPNDFMAQLEDPNAYYLVDGTAPCSRQGGRRARTLEVSSPDEKLYSKYKKEDNVITLYMVIWSYAELRVARALIYTNVTLAKLKQNYAIVGGSARLALTKQNRTAAYDAANVVDNAAGKCNVKETLRTDGQSGKEKGVSDVLMHYIVEDEVTCQKATYQFASGYVVRALQVKKEDEIQDYFEDVITHAKGRRGGVYFGTLAGRLFEDYAIKKLCEGGTFAVKRIGGGAGIAKKKLNFTDMTYPDDVDDIVEEQADMQNLAVGKIGVPTNPSFPAIDALATGGTATGVANDLFFQMKNVNSESSGGKKIALAHLNRLIGHMANLPVRLYQVVPEINFADAKPLKFYNADGSVGVAPPLAQLEEWILSVPVGGLSERKKARAGR